MCITQHITECCKVPFVSRGPICVKQVQNVLKWKIGNFLCFDTEWVAEIHFPYRLTEGCGREMNRLTYSIVWFPQFTTHCIRESNPFISLNVIFRSLYCAYVHSILLIFVMKNMSHDTTKRVFGSFRPGQTNPPAQPQKLARVLKFRL